MCVDGSILSIQTNRSFHGLVPIDDYVRDDIIGGGGSQHGAKRREVNDFKSVDLRATLGAVIREEVGLLYYSKYSVTV